MSKVGKKPIPVSDKVAVSLDEKTVTVKGPLGEISVPRLPGVSVAQADNSITFSLEEDTKQYRSNWGTMRALVQNAVSGVEREFERILILEGVGFRMNQKGPEVEFFLGFSHPVKYTPPEGVKIEIRKDNTLRVSGSEKALVGQAAAEIRALKKPEPYKGKGFRYSDEVIRRKVGKKAGTVSG